MLHDTNKGLDRVNLSEELSKTATWKHLTYGEMKKSNSPNSNASPSAGGAGDVTDGSNKKRRRKRSRTTNNKPPGSNKELSTPPLSNGVKSHPVEHSEMLGETAATQHDYNEGDGIPTLVLQPWMTGAGEETGGGGGYEDEDDNTMSVREKHLNNLNRQGSVDRPTHTAMSSRQNSILESSRSKHLPRQSSEERNPSSYKRQQRANKDRTGGGGSSFSSKRHDSSKKERKHSSHKGPKGGSHNHGHHNHKQPPPPTEEIALPPWEQPYHSPPRKDFGLLHIPIENDSHLTLPDVDPACLKVELPTNEKNDTAKMTLDDQVLLLPNFSTKNPLVTETDNNDNKNSLRKDSLLSSDGMPSSRYPNCYDSGDASAELD